MLVGRVDEDAQDDAVSVEALGPHRLQAEFEYKKLFAMCGTHLHVDAEGMVAVEVPLVFERGIIECGGQRESWEERK